VTRAFFSIIGQEIAKQLEQMNNIFPVIYWKKEDKYVEKRRCGVTLYEKPQKNNFTKTYKKAQLNRRLCMTAYR